ncbi:Transposon Ty3-G Gag-Pol poly [Paramuricea clavata]|uniref:Transposon Ty3-G Gag-Pol poly n=1 Tax=Paramuricea clavata TaxID=317549 RepID=A0A7D9I8R8_PARCT|nr:Transposon Ty3-G Gag-Pol poly [Paramuricea clavata]
MTVEKLRMTFASQGLLEMVVSDNGPAFVSKEFEEFLRKNGVRHVTSAPYNPSFNGLVERAPDPGKTVQYAQNRQKVKYDQHLKPNNFSIGDEVWVRSYTAPEKWSTGKVIEETGPVWYGDIMIRSDGRHQSDLRPQRNQVNLLLKNQVTLRDVIRQDNVGYLEN